MLVSAETIGNDMNHYLVLILVTFSEEFIKKLSIILKKYIHTLSPKKEVH